MAPKMKDRWFIAFEGGDSLLSSLYFRIKCHVTNAHLSGLILNWKMDGLLDWNQNGKWTSNWDELKLENGQATGLESGVHFFFFEVESLIMFA